MTRGLTALDTLGPMELRIVPATNENFADLETLFGPNGAYSGCWCMWNRETNAEFEANTYEPNRRALKQLISTGQEHGLLAYAGDLPVGWAALAPRAEYSRLQRSPVNKPVDDNEVWSVTCFVVDKAHRGQGVARALLEAAVTRARLAGAKALEGYPVAPEAEMADTEVWHGVESMFVEAGFTEIARRRPRRPMYRLDY